MERRKFLTNAAIGGATIVGASALGALDAEAGLAAARMSNSAAARMSHSAAPTPSLDSAISKTSFAEGRITAIKGSVLHVAGSWGGTSSIHVTNATSVWKVRAVSLSAAEIGDGLYARGVKLPDGSIAADAVWINIVNLYCTIKSVGRDRIGLAHGNHALVGRIDRTSTVASRMGATPSRDLSVLQIGKPAQVLGAWRPADDSIDVVRVWVGH